jgi:hypothetical protein
MYQDPRGIGSTMYWVKEYTFIRTLCKDFLLQAAFQICVLMLQAMIVLHSKQENTL